MTKAKADIVDLTTPNKKVKEHIIDVVGKPYNLWKKFQLKGVGSPRLVISDYSEGFHSYFHQKQEINFSTVEIRPLGVLVHFYQKQSHFAWVIPFYRLNYYHTSTHGLYAEGQYIRFHKEFLKQDFEPFFKKLMNHRKEFAQLFEGGPNPGLWN